MANVVEVIFRGVDQITRETQQINSSLGTMQRTAARAGVAILAAFAVREVGRAVKAYTDAADAMTLVENRLKLVTESTAELELVQNRLLGIAIDTRVAFSSTVELYARVARSADQLGLSQQELLDITEGINNAILVSGATTQEASAGLIQFAQGLASGALRGDELRSVLEQMPRLAQAIADGMGITVGQLRELGAEGELSAQRVARAIQSQLGTLQAEADETSSTVGQSLGNLGSAFQALIGRIDDALGATEFLAKGLNAFANLVEDLATEDFEELTEKLEDVRDRIEQIETAIESVSGVQRLGLQNTLDGLLERERELAEKLQAMQEVDLEKPAEGAKQLADNMQRAADQGLRAVDSMLQLQSAGTQLPADSVGPTRAVEPGLDEIANMSTVARQAIGLVTAEIQKSEETFDEWANFLESTARRAAENMQDALAEFLFDPFEEGLDGMLRGFIDTIRRMVAEAAAAKLFKELFGTEEEGGGAAGFLQSVFSGLFGKGKAHGGFTSPGVLHPVNEREPEFLLTRGRSEVVPLSKAAASGIPGGGAVFAPQTTFQLMTAPLSRDQMEEFTQSREDIMFARFKKMLRDDGID